MCRDIDYHNFLFSMKASNPLVMVQVGRFAERTPRTMQPADVNDISHAHGCIWGDARRGKQCALGSPYMHRAVASAEQYPWTCWLGAHVMHGPVLQAYRLLAEEMYTKGWDYPLHLGVTEVLICRSNRAEAEGSSQAHLLQRTHPGHLAVALHFRGPFTTHDSGMTWLALLHHSVAECWCNRLARARTAA